MHTRKILSGQSSSKQTFFQCLDIGMVYTENPNPNNNPLHSFHNDNHLYYPYSSKKENVGILFPLMTDNNFLTRQNPVSLSQVSDKPLHSQGLAFPIERSIHVTLWSVGFGKYLKYPVFGF